MRFSFAFDCTSIALSPDVSAYIYAPKTFATITFIVHKAACDKWLLSMKT